MIYTGEKQGGRKKNYTSVLGFVFSVKANDRTAVPALILEKKAIDAIRQPVFPGKVDEKEAAGQEALFFLRGA
jgi:hypothetical protein